MSTTVSKILIRLTKFSNKTSNVLNVTEQFNAAGVFYQDLSGWDEALVQIISPSEAISFKTTNDDGAVTGQLLPAPEVPINWLTVQGIKLSDGAAASSVTASEIVKFTTIGQYLQLLGATPVTTTTTASPTTTTTIAPTTTTTAPTTTTTSAPAPIEYRLSIFSYDTSGESCASGANAPNSGGYSAESNPLLITAFYTDPSLTSTVSGIDKFVAYAKASDPASVYTARISESGVVTENTAC